MGFNINTEVNLDMTVRITGRDQVTGADLQKLNAALAAIEALGGVIDYPPVIIPESQVTLTNCSYENGLLTYTGGSVDFGFVFGTEKAFGLSKPIAAGYCYAFDLPAYLIDAVNPFAEITTMISSHQNLSQAFQNRNQPICAYTSDFTTDNGENTGLRVGFTSQSGGVMNDFEISNQRLNVKAAVAESTFNVFARDLDTNATQMHTTNVVGLLDQPMYLHVLVRLRSPAADGLSNEQLHLSFQEIFGEA